MNPNKTIHINWNKEDKHQIRYFTALRELLRELQQIPDALPILVKYKVEEINSDNFPRINIDFPEKRD